MRIKEVVVVVAGIAFGVVMILGAIIPLVEREKEKVAQYEAEQAFKQVFGVEVGRRAAAQKAVDMYFYAFLTPACELKEHLRSNPSDKTAQEELAQYMRWLDTAEELAERHYFEVTSDFKFLKHGNRHNVPVESLKCY